MGKTFCAFALTLTLLGCGTHPNRAVSEEDAEIEEAANDMEESKLDYENCLRQQEEENVSCDEWKEIYEEDRAAYELLLKQKGARR